MVYITAGVDTLLTNCNIHIHSANTEKEAGLQPPYRGCLSAVTVKVTLHYLQYFVYELKAE